MFIQFVQLRCCIHPNQKPSRQGRLSFGADGFYEGSFEAGHIWYFFTNQLQQHFLLRRKTPGKNERLEPEPWGVGWFVQMTFPVIFRFQPVGFFQGAASELKMFLGNQGNLGEKGSKSDS